ncbi:MAG TPA: OsmC family protein [Actinomycetota bacterium]|nr:OsmC family protein [Actinomycetota bacterium]
MTAEEIRTALQNAVAYLSGKPEEARYTDSVATAVIENGLQCRVRGPNGEETVTDMPNSVGGGSSAPSPGWLLRAAIASCVATTVAMRAAEEGVDLSHLEVEVDSESDDRGILGMDASVPAGPLSARIRISIESNGASPELLHRIAEEGTARCPVSDAVGRAVPMTTEIQTG